MRVLVTGMGGYIGPVMARALETEGHDVRGLDAGYFNGCYMRAPRDSEAILHKDVRDVTPDDLVGFDAVIHLAALSHNPWASLHPDAIDKINLDGSLNLARAARDAGVKRFLFSSSCGIYGTFEHQEATEECPLLPQSAGEISKVRTEEGIEKLASVDFSPVFLRIATAYGISSRMRLDLVLNNLTASALTTGRVQVRSDGTPWRPMVHVGDIARAFTSVIAAPRANIHNEAFNVGSENHQVKDLAELVRECIPRSMICFDPPRLKSPRSYRVAFGKFRKQVPGFTPVWTARIGVAELCDAFKRVGLKADDLENRNYIRLKQLHYLVRSSAIDEDLRWKEIAAFA